MKWSRQCFFERDRFTNTLGIEFKISAINSQLEPNLDLACRMDLSSSGVQGWIKTEGVWVAAISSFSFNPKGGLAIVDSLSVGKIVVGTEPGIVFVVAVAFLLPLFNFMDTGGALEVLPVVVTVIPREFSNNVIYQYTKKKLYFCSFWSQLRHLMEIQSLQTKWQEFLYSEF